MDIIPIDAAYILAGDSRFRLSCRRDRGQAPILSFTYNRASNLIFMHLDAEFSYSRTGYYPKSNSLELYLNVRDAFMLFGVLRNIVAPADGPGESPKPPPWRHGPDSPHPRIIEEYATRTRALVMDHPLNLTFKPRIPKGFTTYVALLRPREGDDMGTEMMFRLKFWLTEASIPVLDKLQSHFRQGYDRRMQPVHLACSFSGEELGRLQQQLNSLGKRYSREMRACTAEASRPSQTG